MLVVRGRLTPEDVLEEIVREIADMTGNRTLRPQATDMHALLQDIATLARPSLPRAMGLTVLDNMPDDLLMLDAGMLQDSLLNLILNAKAAMPDGGRLNIYSKIVKELVAIGFEDTGHGIPDNLVDNIFEPFVTTREDGTGLGLFISYGVIENHSGHIDVKSKLGKGTVMTVLLPRIEEELEETSEIEE